MPLFRSKRTASLLPSDITRRMALYGRYQFAPQQGPANAADQVNKLVYQALYPIASAHRDEFIAALAAAVLPAGGWAVYGGQRCVRDLLDSRVRHDDYLAMVDSAMRFLRGQGYGLDRVAPVELEIWQALHPDKHWNEDW